MSGIYPSGGPGWPRFDYIIARPLDRIKELHGIEVDIALGPESVDVRQRGSIGIASDETGDRDLVRFPRETVLDASSFGVPDRLDPPLRPHEHQLLEALESNAAFPRSRQGDDLVPSPARPERVVVTGVLWLAWHAHGPCYNSRIAGRHRRYDRHGCTRRPSCCLAVGAVPGLGSLRDHDQRRCNYHELTAVM
jgi:hypothetical protein